MKKNRSGQRGATMAEYAILVAVIAIALIPVILVLRANVSQVYDRVIKSMIKP